MMVHLNEIGLHHSVVSLVGCEPLCQPRINSQPRSSCPSQSQNPHLTRLKLSVCGAFSKVSSRTFSLVQIRVLFVRQWSESSPGRGADCNIGGGSVSQSLNTPRSRWASCWISSFCPTLSQYSQYNTQCFPLNTFFLSTQGVCMYLCQMDIQVLVRRTLNHCSKSTQHSFLIKKCLFKDLQDFRSYLSIYPFRGFHLSASKIQGVPHELHINSKIWGIQVCEEDILSEVPFNSYGNKTYITSKQIHNGTEYCYF